MKNKIFLTALMIFSLSVFSQTSFSSDWAHRAISLDSEVFETTAAGPAYVLYTSENEIVAAVPALPPYYPKLFYKEFFYRDNESQTIRDFRYYDLKTQPNVEYTKKNIPLRDFRFDYWKNKVYR